VVICAVERALKPVLASLIVLLVFLGGGAAKAQTTAVEDLPRELRNLKVLALSPGDQRVVVRVGQRDLQVLEVGDSISRQGSEEKAATVTRIEARRLVLLLETEDGPCEVWVAPVQGTKPGLVRTLCSTTDERVELSKPLIQPISSLAESAQSLEETEEGESALEHDSANSEPVEQGSVEIETESPS